VSLIHRIEALLWMVFGAGGFLAAFFLPGLVVGVLLVGSGFETGLSYERAHQLASSGLGKTFLILFLSLVIWHCAHHLRHLMLDMAGKAAETPAALVAYALAIVGTVATVSSVVAL